ncbi:hypothetical protein TrCOL_g3923 [Triparma columacea]|uniref:Uncharacterized protein n=1 Tax=Triparma columacea TaxID=722753 RepID=A0A9W7G8B9_9STRA|nr:hypothetical protein TrCOL_g3923 [Triparma columacea]
MFHCSSGIGPDEAAEEDDNGALEEAEEAEAEVEGTRVLVLGLITPWAVDEEEDLDPEFKTFARARLPFDIFINDWVGVIVNLKWSKQFVKRNKKIDS